ncbi:Glyoxalase family protein [Neorhizobium galegae bv. orientalis]|nr:Glyoxalase family protein [Neorhizobium galegae bv. orientalis]
MIDHMGIKVADFDRAKAFYDAAFAPLGASLLYMVPAEYTDGVKVGGYGRERPVYWLHEDKPAGGHSQHIAFTANNRAEVDAFYAAAMAAGGTDNGPPGLRADPDGNNIEAVCHAPEGV